MAIEMEWQKIGIGGVIAFVIGWLVLGLLGAIVVALIVLILMGILHDSNSKGAMIKIDWSRITILSVICFVIGWILFGFIGAVLLGAIVLVLLGIIQ